MPHENLTVEEIKTDIIERCSPAVDTREGSFFNDMISGVAYKFWEAFQRLDALLPIAFPDENSGEFLDMRAAEFGIIRKAGTKAQVVMHFTGTDGTVIPKGKVFLTAGNLQFETDEDVTITDGTAEVKATAVETGSAYNVGAGEIVSQFTSLAGLTSFTNDAAGEGDGLQIGTDAETDAALFARLQDRRQNRATSGNAAHYKQWAKEIAGVGDAKVFPIWDGPGTVKVLLVGPDMRPVDSAVVEACAAHIENERPVGPSVTVMSAVGVDIDVSVDATIDGSVSLENVKAAFAEALSAYLTNLIKENYKLTVPAPPDPPPAITVVYNRIAFLLLDIPGVIDYTSLTVGGGTVNITLDAEEVPVPGTVVIT